MASVLHAPRAAVITSIAGALGRTPAHETACLSEFSRSLGSERKIYWAVFSGRFRREGFSCFG